MNKKIKKIKIIILIVFAAGLFLSLASPLRAGELKGPKWLKDIGIENGLLIPAACLSSEPKGVNDCGLTQAFQTIVNFSRLIVVLTGSAALLVFIYGGIMWIIAAGNQERIQKGKAALQAAAIGIVIIFGAWLLVNTIILALTKGEVGEIAKIFGNPWSQEQQIKSGEEGGG